MRVIRSVPDHSEIIWRDVVGYEGTYQVSNTGLVRSVDREVPGVGGCVRHLTGITLRPFISRKGYPKVSLQVEGRKANYFVHRIVATAFLGPAPAGMQVCHWDGNPKNNNLSNLRWGTASENVRDQVRHGRHHFARRRTCPYGHRLVPPNLRPAGLREGARQCQACRRARARVQRNPRLNFEHTAHLIYSEIMGYDKELMAA